jgi:glycosyltransferase involved in cell wall biosynthesis
MQSALIDGLNLALLKGTGVATYARETIKALKLLSYEINLLYGKSVEFDSDLLIYSTTFHDTLSRENATTKNRKKQFQRFIQNIARFKAHEVNLCGQRSEPVPIEATRILNSCDLYRQADIRFKVTKRISHVAVNIPVNIAHWTYPIPLKIMSIPNIYTLHDLVPIKLPHTTLDNKKNYIEKCRKIVSCADHIVTVSEFSRHDIIQTLKVSPEKVTCTYQSIDLPKELSIESPDESAMHIEGLFSLEKSSYYIFFGALEPKKNIGRMIEAYLSSRVTKPLVIVGAPGWKTEGELSLLNSLLKQQGTTIEKRIILFEYLPRLLLLRLLRGASALIFPALYEGFGLPVVEAQSLGVPVIASVTGSIPEISGGKAILVDPYSVADISKAIKKIDSSSDLRNELSLTGIANSMRFNQQEYANRLKAVYDKLL